MSREQAFFRFGAAPRNYGSLVQRWSTLYAIYRPPDTATLAQAFSPAHRSLIVDEWVRRYAARLVRRRRYAMELLAYHGWPPQDPGALPNELRQLYSVNCYPTFAIASPLTRTCKLRQFCPFCYAREVRDVWQRIDAAIPNPRQEQPDDDDRPQPVVNYQDPATLRHLDMPWNVEDREYPSHLVERRSEFFVPFTDAVEDVQAAAEAGHDQKSRYDDNQLRPTEWVNYATRRLAQRLRESAGGRYAVIQEYRPQAAFLRTVVEPFPTCWHIEQRQLFLVAPGHRIEDQLPPIRRGTLTRHEKPTRRVIAEAVARVCAYPRRLLFDDMSLTAIIMNARRSVRTSAFYGAFRTRNRHE